MWITQEYEGEIHVIPDTEPGHVLAMNCFCKPEIKDPDYPQIITHTDLAERIFNASA